VIDGAKTWISNGGIADFYCVFARTQAADVRSDGTTAAGGISAFVVDADAPGLSIAARIDIIVPHPMGTLVFRECRIPATNRLGAEAKDSRSRCAPWIFSAPRWPRPRSALHNAPSMNRSLRRGRGACSAAAWLIFN